MKNYFTIVVLSILILTAGCKTQDKIINPSDDVKDDFQSSKVIPNEYIIEFKPESGSENNSKAVTARVNAVLADYDIPQKSVLSIFESAFQGFAANFDANKAELLAKDPRVQSIIQNMEFTFPIEQPSVKSSKSAPSIQTEEQTIPDGVRFVGGPGNGIGKRVWIMDTGVDLDNPDLCVDKVLSKGFIDNTNGDDNVGHGTKVAGIIAAKDNNFGVVGVAAGATVISVKIFTQPFFDDGTTVLSTTGGAMVAGFEYVHKNASEGDVVNMSFGDPNGSSLFSQLIDGLVLKLAAKKIKCVIAAGQTYDQKTKELLLGQDVRNFSPAHLNVDNIIYTIAALDANSIDLSNANTSFEKKLARWSNYGRPTCDFAAPGEGITSLGLREGGTNHDPAKVTVRDDLIGTSYAAPHVAGILLLGGIGSSEEAYSPSDRDHQTIPIAHIVGANHTPIPNISSVSPIVPSKIGDVITISGTGFGDRLTSFPNFILSHFVSLNGTVPQATDYISWNNTEIKVKVPTGSSSGPLNIRVDGKNSNEMKVVIKPEITSITPNATSVGDIVSITGSGFGNSQGMNFVSFYNSLKLQARDYISWNNTEIRIKLPSFVQSGKVYVSVTGNKSNEVNFTLTATPAIPTIQWAKCFGGSGEDRANSIQQTSDGGYIVAGSSTSTNGDVSGNHGSADYLILKLNSTGNIEWKKSYGGSGFDNARSIQQTSDGGYIVVGSTSSTDGDVSGNHGSADYWILKLNSTGNIEWKKSYGGNSTDIGFSIQQTNDGGYIMSGWTLSNDGDVTGNHGYSDLWIVKLNSNGAIIWQKSIGGSNYDGYTGSSVDLPCIQQTNDGGYIVSGASGSNDGDVSGNHGNNDYWIVKLNSNGDIMWQKSLGGSGSDTPYSIKITSDGGYIVVGNSYSNNGDVTDHHDILDSWVVKLNSSGNIIWKKSLGGGSDFGGYIQQTNDGGYIVAGSSRSNMGDVAGNHGFTDYWIVRLNFKGDIQWHKFLGGSNDEFPQLIQQTSDGGYIVAGTSFSNNGDVTGNHGSYDFWIVKLK